MMCCLHPVFFFDSVSDCAVCMSLCMCVHVCVCVYVFSFLFFFCFFFRRWFFFWVSSLNLVSVSGREGLNKYITLVGHVRVSVLRRR
jgi:hypothetical protein